MKLSVLFDAVFFGGDPIESIKAVKEAGCDSVEFWSWRNKDVDLLKRTIKDLQMEVVAFMTEKISLTDPAFREQYVKDCIETIKVARELECNTIITTVGDLIPGIPRERQHQSIVDGLKRVAPLFEETGITLVVEPLNVKVDLYHSNYFLSSSEEAFQIIDKVGSSNVKVLYDIYHQQISEGNLIINITKNIDKIGHIHAAGHPGRNEITKGEINYQAVIQAIKSTSYNGYFGLEYTPTVDLSESIKVAKSLLY
ncbi:hydroxypyruvate isomerase family protein [Metabacillus endolithicus]|uniref:Hydroxypyruvate isomerase family protein n=1 Tax=Metabacillus endolithicus TaxID=1535204 RepID=A0ABW5C352_9BACI|nr:TIM barrel protein [Metabacillus endolithicus]UPG62623.1 TIM barrel protein [Metabacillus endolithicus]